MRSTFEVPMAETSTAVIASANNLSVKYGTQVVLDGATIAFTEGEHIGLVGRNGSGKSTFLQIAAGVARADSGEFSCRRDLVTGYMPQVSGLDDRPQSMPTFSTARSGFSTSSPNTNASRATARSAPRSWTRYPGRRLEFGTSDQALITNLQRRNPIASWERFPAGKNAVSRCAGRFSRVPIF